MGHSAQGNTHCIICWLYLLEYNNKYIQYVTNYIEYMSYKFGTIRVICFCCVINYAHRLNLGALPRGRGKAHRDGPYGIACMFLFLQIGYKNIYQQKYKTLFNALHKRTTNDSSTRKQFILLCAMTMFCPD